VKPALHQLIRTELEARIQSGDLPPGARLPTEAELQQEHNVSRATAQRVLNDLAQAGLVVRRRGRGTHVADSARHVNLLRLVDPRLGSAKIPGEHRVLSAKVVPAANALVELPGIDDDAPVIQLVRLKYDAADNPFTIETQAIPFALAPGLLDEDLVHLTTREYFAANKVPGVRACMIEDHFSARQGVEDDHMNVLCLGGRVVGPEVAWDLVETFLAAEFSQAERHLRRLGKVASLEARRSAQ